MGTKTKYIDGKRYYLLPIPNDMIDPLPDEIWLPSVTSIQSIDPIKKRIMTRWKNKEFGTDKKAHEAYMDIVREIGELTHLLVTNHYIKKFPEKNLTQNNPDFLLEKDIGELCKKYKTNMELANILFNRFKSKHDIIPENIEFDVFNVEVGYAGRCDFQGYYNGKKILLDIKTSKKIYEKDVGMQLLAYNKAINDWAEELYCLRIRPYIGEDQWEFKKIKITDQWERFLELFPWALQCSLRGTGL